MQHNQDPELERLKVERLKIYAKVMTVFITVIFGTLAVSMINSSIQQRQLALEEKKAEADKNLAEMKCLGEYVHFALLDDDAQRIRFAEYFATLTVSEPLHGKWNEYHERIQKRRIEVKETKEQLKEAEEQGNDKKAEELSKKLVNQQLQLDSLKNPRFQAHIQTRSGKVTDSARRTRQALTAAGLLADYDLVFDLTLKKNNLISVSASNIEVADRILELLHPLKLGEFDKSSSPSLKPNEVHVFLNTQ